MIESEVINKLKRHIEYLKHTWKPHPDYETMDAIGYAIQALEKQIPQSPTYEGDGYADGVLVYDTWICPCCDHHYEVDYDDYDYCPNCGQRIDWRNKNE